MYFGSNHKQGYQPASKPRWDRFFHGSVEEGWTSCCKLLAINPLEKIRPVAQIPMLAIFQAIFFECVAHVAEMKSQGSQKNNALIICKV